MRARVAKHHPRTTFHTLPVSYVTGWEFSSFLPPAKEGDRDEKDLSDVVVFGGSSSSCQRGCPGVALGEARQYANGRWARQGYRAGRHQHLGWRSLLSGRAA